jgi:hypothetical protein
MCTRRQALTVIIVDDVVQKPWGLVGGKDVGKFGDVA